ncbi:flagellar motor switch protein FliN [Candidatus Peregrinibacteria bacterium]|nr:flagellar motor switch protein FliN [Candidatus Peregrinibacteria bacterium]
MAEEEKKKDEDYEKVLSEMGLGAGGTGQPQQPAFETFTAPTAVAQPKQIELLKDVAVNVKVELGRCRMTVEDILKLGPSSVVPLDKLTGDPLSIYVHGRLIAKGEVIVINENFAIRVTEVVQHK